MRSPFPPSFNLILEQVDNAIALFDSSGVLTLFNSKLSELWGLSDHWLQTQPHYQQILSKLTVQGNWSSEDCQRFEQAVQAISEVVLTFRPQHNSTVEIHLSSTADAERLCVFRVSEERSPEQTPGAAIAERKQAIAALQQSEERFRNLVEQTSDWVWEVDLDQCFTYVNPKVGQILGYEPEELLGKTAYVLMQPDEAKRFSTLINFYIARQEPFTNLEEKLLHKAGQSVVLETSGSPIFDAHGELQGYRGISRDITARKQVEQEIRKALTQERELNELKSRFISMTSHEFRTPMSTILLSAEMLENYSQFLTEEKRQKHFHRLKMAIAHIVYLLDDVSLLGQVGGQVRLSLELIHLEEFCRDLIEEIQVSIGAGRNIQFTCEGQPVSTSLDKKLFRSVLSNLLSNALKYSSFNSTIQVRLTYYETEVVLEVQDWGIGIPLEDQSRLFESFHRAKNVANIQGTGLGLAIAKRSVDLHNGQIEVESKLNEGTTFRVRLPL